jgi:hypothetical protein
VLPKREVYVGESVPIDIEVGLRPGVITSVNGLPTLSSGEFTLNNLSRQPERGERDIDGTRFSLLIWHSVLAPVKPGTFALSVETPVTIRVRLTSAQDAKLDDLLGDPFMQNVYGKSNKKDIKIGSAPANLTVLGLPAEGRPPDFSGAVGSFTVASDVAPTTGAAGDPLTLTLRVNGSGNFDRVDTPMLDHVEHWKTYPAKSSFKPADSIGHAGEKTFEQPLIASEAGAQTLPALRFSYFDPQARRYTTVATAPLTVTITPALSQSPPGAPPALVDAAAGPAAPAPNGLRADHAVSGPYVHSLMPLYLQPRFATIPAALALLFAAGWWQTRRRGAVPAGSIRNRDTPPSAAAKRAMAEIETAASAGNPTLFFNTARAAVRQALADRWHTAAETVTAALVAARLGNAGKDIAELFQIADELQYAGEGAAAPDLARWAEIVRRELTRGEVP